MKTKTTTELLAKVRCCMKDGLKLGKEVHAVIIPSSDSHQSEYLASCDKRVGFISGFTGSAGTAVITYNKAALWTDGRYFLQAETEMDSNWKLMKMGLQETPSIEKWLCSNLSPNSTVGINPCMFSFGAWKKMKMELEKKGHMILETPEDLIDKVWINKPPVPSTKLMIVSEDVCGKSSMEKIQDIQKKMKAKDAKWLVITALDEIAWLFNMRASDIEYNPVFFAYSVIGHESIHLFLNPTRITLKLKSHLTAVTIQKYDDIIPFLKRKCANEETLLCSGSSYAIVSAICEEKRLLSVNSVVSLMKCIKNRAEIDGMISANKKDAVALCRYFSWMDSEVPNNKVTECSAADKSKEFRSQEDGFVSLSFATISSSGPTGSIIHYSPNHLDDKPVLIDQLYLCDSGAQFKEGTTDTTRTLHFGIPTQHEKECFTRVLKGHIALASIIFPSGTKGYSLDTLARMHLWKDGLDYRHGTGHGVGCFLNVHEGPVGAYIGNSDRVVSVANEVEIHAGMVITDEPGYYEDGKFGIRIENALLCKDAETKFCFGGKKFFSFEAIALVPIQKKLMERSMLTDAEVKWLNAYHQRCRDVIGPLLQNRGFGDTYRWLLTNTEPIV